MASKIAEFAERQKAFNERQSTAVDGVAGDVKDLKDLIEKLQNSPGEISTEDQAILDDLDARASALTTKVEALDALTPPPVPPAP